MEWRLEAAMIRNDGFPAAVVRLESRLCDSWLPGGSHTNPHHRSAGSMEREVWPTSPTRDADALPAAMRPMECPRSNHRILHDDKIKTCQIAF